MELLAQKEKEVETANLLDQGLEDHPGKLEKKVVKQVEFWTSTEL